MPTDAPVHMKSKHQKFLEEKHKGRVEKMHAALDGLSYDEALDIIELVLYPRLRKSAFISCL